MHYPSRTHALPPQSLALHRHRPVGVTVGRGGCSFVLLAGGVTKQARTVILRLSKRPRSTEEMVEAIESLRTTRAEEQVTCQPYVGRFGI